MSTLLLRFSAPLQSWGARSRFSDRDTEKEPTLSGVIGLLSCAMGRGREADPSDFSSLKMAVRVDRQGGMLKDFHTALNVRRASGGKTGNRAVLSDRYYITDARFLVALEGDHELLAQFDQALQNPKWPLFLGRKSCPPGEPVRLLDGLMDASLQEALETYPCLDSTVEAGTRLRCVVDDPEGEQTRQDVPLSFLSDRRVYGTRRVSTIWVPAVACQTDQVSKPKEEVSE